MKSLILKLCFFAIQELCSTFALMKNKIYHFEISDTFLSDALEILGLRSPVYDWDPQSKVVREA